jgi:hypothetical protein
MVKETYGAASTGVMITLLSMLRRTVLIAFRGGSKCAGGAGGS